MEQDIREDVRKKYAHAITNKLSCCGTRACSNPVTGNLYEVNEIEGLSEDVVKASFGCGNPTALAELYAGEVVLDFIRAKKPAEMLVEDEEYTIRTAVDSDLAAIDKLLLENGLTTSGVRENLSNFLVVECESITGVIGIEFAGHGVMLRSMAISQELRKRGIATALVERSLEIARTAGIEDAYLLTNTAERFMSRWGFHKVQRSEIPTDLMQSSALNNFCPSSSICMKLEL